MKINFDNFPKKVAIIGSRSYAKVEGNAHRAYLEGKMKFWINRFMDNLPDDTIFISGHAIGVDQWAEQEANRRKMTKVIYNPHDEKLDNYVAACFARNTKIANSADILVAMVDETAMNGSKNTIDKARRRGIPIIILYFSPEAKYLRMDSTWK